MSDPKLGYVSWLKTGLSTKIIQVDGQITTPITRPQVEARVEINELSSDPIIKQLSLLGPGDVKSINVNNIVKAEPTSGTNNFESNYFPYIEFYDEYFPWRFTPAMPEQTDLKKDKLTPWIFLAVLAHDNKIGEVVATDEFEYLPFDGKGLPGIKVKASFLPKHQDQLWAWAHVQSTKEISKVASNAPTGATDREKEIINLKGIQNEEQDFIISRLVSSRLLSPNTNYTAFLLPTYELGRLAGLNKPFPINPSIDAQQRSYNEASPNTDIEFPVYYKWSFKTGELGDFEQLVRDLKPVELPEEIGKRPLDIASTLATLVNGGNLSLSAAQAVNSDNDPILNLLSAEGALAHSTFVHTEWPATGKTSLENLLNSQGEISQTVADNSTVQDVDFPNVDINLSDDPIVNPTLYGRWHIGKDTVSATALNDSNANNDSWFDQLNLDPQYRLAAGLGARVIQENQEEFMSYAWQQVGEVIEANRKIAQAQFSKQVLNRVYEKYVAPLEGTDAFLQMTNGLQRNVKFNASTTVRKQVEASLLPESTLSHSFKKVMRPRGTVVGTLNKGIGLTASQAISYGIQRELVSQLNDPAVLEVKTIQDQPSSDFHATTAMIVQSKTKVETAPVGGTNALIIAQDKIDNVFAELELFIGLAEETPPLPLNITDVETKMTEHIQPEMAVSRILENTVQVMPAGIALNTTSISTVAAYPSIPFTMSTYLKQISNDYIIPNIHLIEDNSIGILAINAPFIESFMVGLNHEFSKELLWREYPTDQRGTIFRNFWNTTDDLTINQINSDEAKKEAIADIRPIDKWYDNSKLGTHQNSDSGQSGSANSSRLAVIIRGELLRKFPNTIIYAVRGDWEDPALKIKRIPKIITDANYLNTAVVRYPKFKSKVEPDITMIGFDLTIDEAKGTQSVDPGWFIVVKERTGETRFGLDLGNIAATTSWDQLSIGVFNQSGEQFLDLTKLTNTTVTGDTTQWNKDSAQQAYILYQKPVMISIHAANFLDV